MAAETENELPGGAFQERYDPIAIDVSRQKAEEYLGDKCTGDYIAEGLTISF